MKWNQLVVVTTEQNAEAFSAFFEEHGAISVTFSDNADSPVYEPEKGTLTLWPDTSVTGLFESSVNISEIVERMQRLDFFEEHTHYRIETIEDKDWTRVWMDDFHPIQFGRRLWICPSWREPPETDAINIMLDPGLAFGTGTHPTTAMCLEWLDSQQMKEKTLTDYGCGSGILAIAALKLGAKHAFAVDIDPQAIIATKANAEKNDVSSGLTTLLSNNYDGKPTDIVVANILSGPLKSLFSTLSSLCHQKGTLVLSGILKEQAEDIIEVYQTAFSDFAITERGEWIRIVATKR